MFPISAEKVLVRTTWLVHRDAVEERGYAEFDAGAPKKFVIDPHQLLKKAA